MRFTQGQSQVSSSILCNDVIFQKATLCDKRLWPFLPWAASGALRLTRGGRSARRLQGGSFDSARGQWQTSAMNFDRAADELHREEFSRLAYVVTPRPEALRAMRSPLRGNRLAIPPSTAWPHPRFQHQRRAKIHHHLRQSVSS